jgi:hypothetical protein
MTSNPFKIMLVAAILITTGLSSCARRVYVEGDHHRGYYHHGHPHHEEGPHVDVNIHN